MAKIENREVLKRIEKECFIHPAAEATPNTLSSQVVPVIISNTLPDIRVVDSQKSTTGTTTIKTTSSNKRTFIVGFSIGITANAANDSTYFRVKYQPKYGDAGSTAHNIFIPHTTGGIRNDHYYIDLSKHPLEIEPGSVIQHVLSFTAGTCSHNVTIFYYEIEED